MIKKVISWICSLAILMGLLPAVALPVKAAEQTELATGTYQVGYAKVDLNPYIVDGDFSSGLMALPLAGEGDNWDRLSDRLLDDNGDGVIDKDDGISATCIVITDHNGEALFLITIDFLGGYKGNAVRAAIVERVNAAIASGDITDIQEIDTSNIHYAGTHTHNSIGATSYVSGGKTGTNADGVDLSVVNENLGIWVDRIIEDLCDMAMEALKDRAAATLTKDQLSASEVTTPAVKGKALQATRHYWIEVDGERFVGGNGFNAVDKNDYENPDDYRTPRGVSPEQFTRAAETMHLLRFSFEDSSKLPVVFVSWASHPSKNNSNNYENSSKTAVSSDYVNTLCRALEYGCEVTFDPATGYIQSWEYGTTQKYRAAFFQADGGNVNGGNDELITYSGSEGDVEQYGFEWFKESAKTAEIKGAGCNYGVILGAMAQECVEDGLNETAVAAGDIQIMTRTYSAATKNTFINELSYKAAVSYEALAAVRGVGLPYKYTDPDTGEIYLIASRFHASNIIAYWNTTLGGPKSGHVDLPLNAIMLGKDVAFVTIPGEPFNYYYKDTTLTGDAKYAPENNLWNDLIDESSYGRPFVLGYCDSHQGYFPNDETFIYNEGSTNWAIGSYEAHSARHERGTGENMLWVYDQMLNAMAHSDGDMSYTGSCAHCGEDQLWQPYSGETTLTTGHYYLCSDVVTNVIKISGGQTVCLDLNGHTLSGETRAFSLSDSTRDVLNIMDSSEAQTGKVQGCGTLYGAAIGLYGGSVSIGSSDVVNLYSGTLTSYERNAYSVSVGGVLSVSGTFNMYGGAIIGGTASSFSGSYYSGGTATANKTGSGGTAYVNGTLNLYGGTISGGTLTAITGTITETETGGYTYSQEEVPLDGSSPCLRLGTSGKVNLGGDATVEHIQLINSNGLNITGRYTGTAELKYSSIEELTDLTVVGGARADAEGNPADVSRATITLADAPDQTVAVKGGDLVVSDSPNTYATCAHCGESRWVSVTDADMDTMDKHGMLPGHYILAEDVTTVQKQLNYAGTNAGSYCIDLAGHTFTGTTRAFYTYSGATLNIMDSVGNGVVEATSGASVTGGVIYAATGSCVNLYGGTLRHNTANSDAVTTGGVICVSGADLHIHGGTVEGGNVTGYGAAIYVASKAGQSGTLTLSGGQVTAGTAAKSGSCIYVGSGGSVTLSGDGQAAEIFYAGSSADSLTIEDAYTGSVGLRYSGTVTITDGMDLGNSTENADLSGASIAFTKLPCKTLSLSGTDLVVSTAASGHVYSTAITAPTCTQAGTTVYTCACGDTYTVETAATGHSYETVTVRPTCSLDGSKTDTCAVCGDVQVEIIPATGHDYQTVTTEATCTEAGYTTYTCAVCGDTYIADEVAAAGHAYQAVTTEATCTEVGYTTYTCAACGDTYIADEIPATGHNYQTVTLEATCTAPGSITDTCAACGHVIVETIPATGHSFLEGTEICGTCGMGPCAHCGEAQWTPVTDADVDAMDNHGMLPGHYVLTEDVTTVQKLLNYAGTNSGSVCIDLAGHTFTGTTRAFYPFSGATLNIMDSVGTGVVEGTSGASVTGGVIYAAAGSCVNLYGGTLRHNTANSDVVTTGGVICVSGAALHIYGGTVEGGNVTGYGGAIYVASRAGQSGNVTVSGGQVTAGTAEGKGNCIYVGSGGTVTLSGDAHVAEIFFMGSSADSLIIEDTYTGSAALGYYASVDLSNGVDIGNCSSNADISGADITFSSVACKAAAISGTDLVIAKAETGHDYAGAVTEPTCTDAGYTTYTCLGCGDVYTADEVEATGHSYEAAVTAPTCTTAGYTTYTCACGDSYAADEVAATGHGFENGVCTLCGEADPDYVAPSVKPTISLKYPSLSFEDVIIMNVYYSAANTEDVVEMGLITYKEKPETYSVETADAVIPGYDINAADGLYFSSTEGIAPKDIGDTIYFAVYAELADGTYTYTSLIGYSPKTYAANMLKTGTTEMKTLVAAMLNYGAAAQNYFSYKTDALVNADMTEDQKALVADYSADMIAAVTQPSGAKLGTLVNNGGHSKFYPTISFEGAFCINYYFQPKYTVSGDVTMYIWNLEDYEAAEVLSKDNATKSVTMSLTETGEYLGVVDGIAAKDLDKAVYVSVCYSDGTTDYCYGVIGYTIGLYCKGQAAKTGTLADLAAACAVYGYYAKQLFG